jgi:ATP-dependent Clp protease ATP-binding subunit ClpA
LQFGKPTKRGLVKGGVKGKDLEHTFEAPEQARISGKKPPLLTAE